MTESGGTARFLSRFRSSAPIYAFSRHDGARRRMALMRDVFPIAFDSRGLASRDAARSAVKQLFDAGQLGAGERVIFTSGDTMEQHGATNTLRLLQVGADGRAEGLGRAVDPPGCGALAGDRASRRARCGRDASAVGLPCVDCCTGLGDRLIAPHTFRPCATAPAATAERASRDGSPDIRHPWKDPMQRIWLAVCLCLWRDRRHPRGRDRGVAAALPGRQRRGDRAARARAIRPE